MPRLARAAALVIPLLAALACGGRVGLVGGGTCPPASAVVDGNACTTAGQTCTTSVSFCGSSEDVQCSCENGAWSCPALAAPGCIVACPTANTVQPGSACELATQSVCTVPYTFNACGVAVTGTCSCQSEGVGSSAASWTCSTPLSPECPDAQPPGCPDPSFVSPDGACSASPQLTCSTGIPLYDCSGNFLGDQSCQCFGGAWSCATIVDCPDAGGCPDPDTLQSGQACFEPGLQCPGNPQLCDGATFYDAFQCEGGSWVDVATTGCAFDGGGPVDAGATPGH